MENQSDHNWPEDSHLENGNYLCHCVVCKTSFFGYKRRMVCKGCDRDWKLKYAAMTPEERLEHGNEVAKLLKQFRVAIKS